MTGIYYDLMAILRGAGCDVRENSINAGWRTRSRSSGGFPSAPLGVWWHHTASKTSVDGDLQWQCHSCPDRPVGNMLLDRNGIFWPVAAGASNCAGKGGPHSFSRGTVPLDSGNTRGFQIEVANNGTGEPWPQPQIDAFFRGSNALNAHVGNLPTDVITHQVWAPSRKIDPATANAVLGPWRPRAVTSSGTWSLDDIKSECQRRASGTIPGPIPPLPGGQEMNHPVAVWRLPDTIDIFCVGDDKSCWHLAFDYANGWRPWENLGGVFSGDIAACINGPDRIDLFGRGQNDGPLFQRWWQQPDGWNADWVAIADWPG